MESVSLIGKNINNLESIAEAGPFVMENKKINVGRVSEEDMTLSKSTDPDNRVIVHKNAFSCNYRDKTLILKYNDEIEKMNLGGAMAFSYIGSEFVGEVVEIGKNIKTLKVGDRVVANATYPSEDNYVGGLPSNHASRRMDDFYENKLIKIPDSMPDDVASCFVIAAFTAYSMIRKVIKPKAKVLVTAAKSNTSLAAISALRNFPVEVYVMTSSNAHSDMLYENGVKEVFVVDHNLENYMEDKNVLKFVEKTGGFDAVIDPLFDIHLSRIISLMGMNGKYVTCGLYNQFPRFSENEFQAKGQSFTEVMKIATIKNISIIGNCIGLKEDFDLALKHYQEEKFNIIMGKVFTAGEEAAFFDLTYNFKERLGKVAYKY